MARRPPNGKVRVTYLEMRSRPRESAPERPAGVELERAAAPDLVVYRRVYRRVGDPWQWVARRMLGDDDLREVLERHGYELWWLRAGAGEIGFAELDRQPDGEVEIRYFGLVEEWIGRGVGRWFLRAMVDLAWDAETTRRVWLHTCELDHPGALRFYQRGGFVPYGEDVEEWVDPARVSVW